MVEKKFTSVYEVNTHRKAEKLLDELRSKIPFGWKERDAYVQKLENGKFRVVYKQVHQLN